MATTHKARGYLVKTVEVNPEHVRDGRSVAAIFEDYYSSLFFEGDLVGYGSTEEEAISDLFELPNADWFKDFPPESDAELDHKLRVRGWKWSLKGGNDAVQ